MISCQFAITPINVCTNWIKAALSGKVGTAKTKDNGKCVVCDDVVCFISPKL